uniref:Uncharacterized protein n=1 Tax=Eutreptiella gymnastica TaxID=73025 RepID=A0A7S1I798_9EUGL|mmetsp:Transcript_135606/g.235353  ORF Transcript_135606/g.235353 Transcript_135606/m.235353 type:complete len:151 (+) Transcript_135606:94-546(+)
MSQVDERFTAVVEEVSQKRSRPRGPGCGGQAEKYKQNRSEVLEPKGTRVSESGSVAPRTPDDKIDVFLSDKDGFLDPMASAPKHFAAIDDNIDEIERKMMADAPKADPNYKIEDIFDQSYKDLMKEGATSVVAESISAQGQNDNDDEFDF